MDNAKSNENTEPEPEKVWIQYPSPLTGIIEELEREEYARRNIYPWMIRQNKLTKEEAEIRNKRLKEAIFLLHQMATALRIERPIHPTSPLHQNAQAYRKIGK